MRKNEDTEAERDDINDPRNRVYIFGIGNVKIIHLNDGLLELAKLDDKQVWSNTDFNKEKKHKNISIMSRIVNSHPNKRIMPRVKALDCRDKHRVSIPRSIKQIDRFLIKEVPAFVEDFDIAKVEVITWKKQGVPQLKKKQKNKTLM